MNFSSITFCIGRNLAYRFHCNETLIAPFFTVLWGKTSRSVGPSMFRKPKSRKFPIKTLNFGKTGWCKWKLYLWRTFMGCKIMRYAVYLGRTCNDGSRLDRRYPLWRTLWKPSRLISGARSWKIVNTKMPGPGVKIKILFHPESSFNSLQIRIKSSPANGNWTQRHKIIQNSIKTTNFNISHYKKFEKSFFFVFFFYKFLIFSSRQGGMLVVSVSVAGLVTLAAMTQPALAPEAKHSLLQYVTGKYLLPSNCRVHFEWEEPQLVGETMTFTVKVSKNSRINIFILRVKKKKKNEEKDNFTNEFLWCSKGIRNDENFFVYS